MWFCRCECGIERMVLQKNLIRSASKSCGCLKAEMTGHRFRKTLTMGTSRIRSIWEGMMRRCNDPRAVSYPHYGGKGIKVCDRWRLFENFYADMNEPPDKSYSLDRIDNDGNYEPENCRWATRLQQHRNRTDNAILEFNGECKCVTEWAEFLGVRAPTLFSRLKYGWSIEKTLTTPVRKYRKN